MTNFSLLHSLFSTNQMSELRDLSFESSLVLMPFLVCHTLVRVSQVLLSPLSGAYDLLLSE